MIARTARMLIAFVLIVGFAGPATTGQEALDPAIAALTVSQARDAQRTLGASTAGVATATSAGGEQTCALTTAGGV